MKKRIIAIPTSLIMLALICVYAYQLIAQFGTDNIYSSAAGKVLSLELKQGDSAHSVLNKLKSKALIDEPLILAKIWLRLHPEYSDVKKGYYEFDSGTSLAAMFEIIARGKVKQFSITLVEGLTLKQWLTTLASNKHIVYDIADLSALYTAVTEQGETFCTNQYQSLEGCLLANTYFFDRNTNASIIIQRAYDSMRKLIQDEWKTRFLDTAYKTPYDMLIMASIIEKETAVESERGLISGVFDNRLKRNMRLQTDPTVIYGIGDVFDGNLTRKHLRQKTPYNTYVIKGLPITPIAMAGPDSIRAAAQPELTEAIYFVAKGDGTHQFSETLAQHNAAVREYQLKKGKQ